MDNVETALRLSSVKGIGIRKILTLYSKFPKIEDVFGASVKELTNLPGIDRKLASAILSGQDEEFVQSQIETLQTGPFEILTYFDDDYPEQLKTIYDPPILIFKNGDFIPQDKDAIAIVGTRNCTNYSRDVIETLVSGLVKQKLTIVSGFARGVDSIAHKAAINFGGRTVAVLGNGINRVYPSENRNLRNQIVQNGVYCSEFPFGTAPDAINFPRRNRIISGLSLGTIVIEAGQKSGAVITAYYSLDQNREVFAVPGRITDKKSAGTNKLIQKGAKLITCVEDVLEEIDKNRTYPAKPRQLELNFKFSGDEKEIFDLLTHEPIQIDKLSEKAGKSSFVVLSILLSLELKGAVRQFAGKMFTKIG